MSKNVFRDLGFSEEEAAGLKLKSYLFMALQEIVRASGLTQKQIAEAIGADQPKVSRILNGKLNEFSIERITEYLQRLGHDIHISTEPCPRSRRKGTIVMRKRRLVSA
jgi:predicted XRE-type DNA-binding protein